MKFPNHPLIEEWKKSNTTIYLYSNNKGDFWYIHSKHPLLIHVYGQNSNDNDYIYYSEIKHLFLQATSMLKKISLFKRAVSETKKYLTLL